MAKTKTNPQAAARPTKLNQIVALLERPDGATIAEMSAALDWKPHSVRGAIAGALKRRGLNIVSEKAGDERRYRIEAGA